MMNSMVVLSLLGFEAGPGRIRRANPRSTAATNEHRRDRHAIDLFLRRRCRFSRACRGAVQQQGALAGVARERCRPLELGAGLGEASELDQKVATNPG